MKKIFSILMVLVSSLVAGPQAFYANGVGNGDEGTIASSNESARSIKEATNIESIGILKNTSQGTAADLLEAASQMTGFDKLWKEVSKYNNKLANKIKSLTEEYSSQQDQELALKIAHFKLGIKDRVELDDFIRYITFPNSFKAELIDLGFETAEISWMAAKASLAEDINSLASGFEILVEHFSYENTFSLLEEDKEKMRRVIEEEVCQGNGVNIIAHSQGNLMMDQVLNENFQGLEHQIKLISVASPADKVYGNGLNIKLREDLVAKSFTSSLPGNYTNYPSDLEWVIPNSIKSLYKILFSRHITDVIANSIPLSKIAVTSIYNSRLYGDFTGHGFVSSYIYNGEGSKTRQRIVSGFIKNQQLLSKTFIPPRSCPSVDKPEKRENLWLGPIELKGYGSNVPQMKSIKFDSRVHYDSNEKPDSLKVKICYALSKTPYWREGDFVRGPRYSTKTFKTKRSSQKISNVSFYIPKTIPLGDYYIVEKVDCDNQVQETDEEENQVQYQKIKVIAQEKEDIRTTDIKISGTGTGKIVIKNTMVYDGSNPDIGWVYQAYFFSSQPSFSTAKQFFVTRAKMGWGKNSRKRKQLTVNISKLPVGTFYIWVIVKKLDNSHDDDTSNNYFRVGFTTRPKSN